MERNYMDISKSQICLGRVEKMTGVFEGTEREVEVLHDEGIATLTRGMDGKGPGEITLAKRRSTSLVIQGQAIDGSYDTMNLKMRNIARRGGKMIENRHGGPRTGHKDTITEIASIIIEISSGVTEILEKNTEEIRPIDILVILIPTMSLDEDITGTNLLEAYGVPHH
jgi:hypothetical protein